MWYVGSSRSALRSRTAGPALAAPASTPAHDYFTHLLSEFMAVTSTSALPQDEDRVRIQRKPRQGRLCGTSGTWATARLTVDLDDDSTLAWWPDGSQTSFRPNRAGCYDPRMMALRNVTVCATLRPTGHPVKNITANPGNSAKERTDRTTAAGVLAVVLYGGCAFCALNETAVAGTGQLAMCLAPSRDYLAIFVEPEPIDERTDASIRRSRSGGPLERSICPNQ